MYPDPETFNPGRWLDPAYPTYREPLTQYPNLNGFSQFGFGRRTCQGVPIVEQDLFLSMGGMAWAFDMRKKRDSVTGKEIPVHWNEYTPLLIAKPEKFQFDAVPRSEEKMALMSVMFEFAKEEDDTYAEEFAEKASEEMKLVESDSDHDVLINVRDSSPETDGEEHRIRIIGEKKEPMVMEKELCLMPGAWAA
jgi:Cytochrome P450